MTPNKGNCSTNADCSSSQYCSVYPGATACCAASNSAIRDACTSLYGNCSAKYSFSSTFTTGTLNLPKGELTYYKSRYSVLTQWSAKNYCEAYGLRLLTMADLGLQDSAEEKGYCCFDNTNTSYQKAPCICAGDPDCSKTFSEVSKIGSAILGDVREGYPCDVRSLRKAGLVTYSGQNSSIYPVCVDK